MLSSFPNAERRRRNAKARESGGTNDLRARSKPALRTLVVRVAAIVLYLCFGALIFCAIEHKEKDKTFWHRKLDYVKRQFINRYNMSEREFYELQHIIKNRLKEIKDAGKGWDYYQSLYFSSTVTTTIGYGHITPQTQGGRIFLIIFALIGIPLNILALASVGEHISIGICHLIYTISKNCCHTKKVSNINIKVMVISVALMIIMLFVGGALYCFTEDWTYVDSIYYCFVALATIGFGDLVPNDGHAPDSSYEKGLWFLRTMYISIGLSLVSTVFTSISNAMEEINAVMGWVKRSEKYKTTKNVFTGCNGHGRKVSRPSDQSDAVTGHESPHGFDPDNPYEVNRRRVRYEESNESCLNSSMTNKDTLNQERVNKNNEDRLYETALDVSATNKYQSTSQVYEEVDTLSMRSNSSNVYLYDWTSGAHSTGSKHQMALTDKKHRKPANVGTGENQEGGRLPYITRRHRSNYVSVETRPLSGALDLCEQAKDSGDFQTLQHRKGTLEFKGRLTAYETIREERPSPPPQGNRPPINIKMTDRVNNVEGVDSDKRGNVTFNNAPRQNLSNTVLLDTSMPYAATLRPCSDRLPRRDRYREEGESSHYEVPFTLPRVQGRDHRPLDDQYMHKGMSQTWDYWERRGGTNLSRTDTESLESRPFLFEDRKESHQEMEVDGNRQGIGRTRPMSLDSKSGSSTFGKRVNWDDEYSIERQISDFAFHSRRSEPEGAPDSPNGTITRTFQSISNSIEEKWKSDTVQGILDLAQSVYMRTLEQRGKNTAKT